MQLSQRKLRCFIIGKIIPWNLGFCFLLHDFPTSGKTMYQNEYKSRNKWNLIRGRYLKQWKPWQSLYMGDVWNRTSTCMLATHQTCFNYSLGFQFEKACSFMTFGSISKFWNSYEIYHRPSIAAIRWAWLVWSISMIGYVYLSDMWQVYL